MRIMYVVSKSVEINTSASIRNCAIMSGLMRLGHSVTLVSTMPDRKSEFYDESLLPDGVNVIYLSDGGSQKIFDWLKRNPLLKPLKRIASKKRSAIEIYDSQKWIINHIDEVDFNDFDCIISSSDPKSSHLFVYEALFRKEQLELNYNRKWIQIWGDPFLGDVSMTSSQTRSDVFQEEKKLVGAADEIYYVSGGTLKVQKQIYPESSEKMHYIPIPYLKERIYSLRDLSTVNQVELCYCGDYPSLYRDIKPLYDAVNHLLGVHLTICGSSDIKLQETSKITVLPRQGHKIVEEIEEKADILVHLCNNSGTQIPGKIYQYSGTNKPILFILDGEKDNNKLAFEKYRRFIFADNNEESIQRGIKMICSTSTSWNPLSDFSIESVVKSINIG